MAHLVVFVLLDAALLTVWALGRGVRRRPPGPALGLAVALLQVVVVAEVVTDLLSGRAAVEPAVHLGYQVAAVLVVPGLVLVARGPGDRGWGSVVLAVACAALLVVQIRLVATGAPA